MPNLYGLARIGRDAELRSTPAGESVANVSLAFNWGRKGEDGKRPTTWVDGALWGKRAEALAPYLTKGTSVVVTLEDIHIETYTARDQSTGSKIVGRIVGVELAGGGERKEASEPASAPAPRPAPAPKPAPKPAPAGGFSDFDDDIPF